jgi:O-6-methylguanine DNA methyltransferase
VYVVRPSPLGPAYVAVSAVGVAAVSLDACASDFEAAYERRFRRPVVPAADPLPMLAELDRALTEGNPGSLPLDLRGLSPFAAAVLTVTAAIPRGEVRTYAEVAAAVGRPGAARAVGGALARNPVPLVVPCHRVVRSGGHLGGYGWGPARKRALLAAEGAPVGALAPASSSNSRR